MKSRITLYWGTPLTPERNLKIDEIGDFLAGYTSQTISNFQYIKHALDIEIKVDLTQNEQEMHGSVTEFINYIKVENEYDTGIPMLPYKYAKPVYYFVLKVTPRAEHTILLTCHLDTINSFTEYEVGARTIIHRQHEDRFTWEDDKSSIYRKIDYVDEGISPLLYKTNEEPVAQFIGGNWNIIYRNVDNIDENAFNEVNPITAWLVPDSPVKTKYQSTGLTFTPDRFPTGYLLIGAEMNGGFSIPFQIGTDPQFERPIQRGAGVRNAYMLVHRYESRMDIQLIACSSTLKAGDAISGWQSSSSLIWYKQWDNAQSITFNVALEEIKGSRTLASPITYPAATTHTLSGSTATEEFTKGIDDIDRKDSKIVKIISLPYPPAELDEDELPYAVFKSMFSYDPGDKVFKLNVESPTFDYIFQPRGFGSPFGVFMGMEVDIEDDSVRFMDDPKLFNSSFYCAKFVYDSFNYDFIYEFMSGQTWREQVERDSVFNLRFIVSTTFNSKFMFAFPDYFLEKSVSDYDGYLPISRNNELAVFSSQYVTYLRTAYRYDLKNVQRTQLSSALQGLGSAASAGMSLFSRNALGFGAGVFGITNAVLSAQRAEDGLKSKLAQMEAQAVSVGNADDIDLLIAYTKGGQAKMCYYEVSPVMKDALNNLFHYCGYARETSGIPNETSRIHFNFVQADLEIINPTQTPSWAIAEIKQRYSLGVTILHKWNGVYDPDQKLENWERGLFEE